MYDPHAVKIHVDGSCWDNPGGAGGFAIRVDWGCDSSCEPSVVEFRGFYETTNNRMELRACICGHQWVWKNLAELRARRILILTDSTYVSDSYVRVIWWSRNDYRNADGRPVKNEDLLRELMTLRRKLARSVLVEVKLIPRRSDEGAKEVDSMAKAAGRTPANVDRGFQKGKIGRPKNNSKRAAKPFPAGAQAIVIRPYKSGMARRDIQLFKFELWNDREGMFFDKFEAYTSNEIGNELHRQNVFRVRMNDIPRFPQILEIVAKFTEAEWLSQVRAAAILIT